MRRHAGFVIAVASAVLVIGFGLTAVGVADAQSNAVGKAGLDLWGNAWFVSGTCGVIAGVAALAASIIMYVRRPRSVPESAGPGTAVPALPPPSVDVSVACKVDGDRLRLEVTNEGLRGEFTARGTSILDPEGKRVETRSWPVPWSGPGSVETTDILQSGSRALDFARFVPDEGPWPHRALWEFFSLPGSEPAIAMHNPVDDKRELAPARFVVTVRIFRSEPSPGYTDRRFAIGVTSGAVLMCEAVEPPPSPRRVRGTRPGGHRTRSRSAACIGTTTSRV